MNQHTKANALGYATTLACALWEKHYKAEAPDWKPQPDLLGLLTQIDNMTAGLVRLKVTVLMPDHVEKLIDRILVAYLP
jgi:hypothetical protein